MAKKPIVDHGLFIDVIDYVALIESDSRVSFSMPIAGKKDEKIKQKVYGKNISTGRCKNDKRK